jgi:hypothetical protein
MASIIVPKRSLILPAGSRGGLVLPRRQRGFMLVNPARFGNNGGDPYFSSVQLLMHMDGVDGSTTFTDVTGKTCTASGNAQLDTADKKYGLSSGLFDGSGDVVTCGATTDFPFTSDFTIEWWAKANSGADRCVISKRSTGSVGWAIEMRSTGALWLRALVDGTYSDTRFTTSTGVFSFGVWTHIALTRSGPTYTFWVGGSSVGTTTFSTGAIHSDSAAQLRLGSANTIGENYYSGWLDEVRVTNGVCRYAGTFTPPTAAFPDF